MEAEDFLVVDVSYPFGGDVGRAREGVDLFGEEVGEDDDGIVAVGDR